jgi:hypothetical protein
MRVGERLLALGDESGALRLGGERGEPLGLLVGLLHDVQVQFKGDMRVQAEQILFSKQMAVRGRGGVGVGEQAAQQHESIAQGGAGSAGLTIGPQEGRQFAAGVHTPFDRQIEQ